MDPDDPGRPVPRAAGLVGPVLAVGLAVGSSAGFAIGLAAVARAGGGSVPSIAEVDPMTGPTEPTAAGAVAGPVARWAAAELGFDPSSIEVRPARRIAGSACVRHAVVDTTQLDAQPEHVVVLPDGTLVGGRSPGVVDAVLDRCHPDGPPPASAVADAVLAHTDLPGPLRLLGSGWARRRLVAAGLDDRPPTLTVDGGTSMVTFLVEDTELEVVGQVTVRWVGDGPLRIDIDEI